MWTAESKTWTLVTTVIITASLPIRSDETSRRWRCLVIACFAACYVLDYFLPVLHCSRGEAYYVLSWHLWSEALLYDRCYDKPALVLRNARVGAAIANFFLNRYALLPQTKRRQNNFITTKILTYVRHQLQQMDTAGAPLKLLFMCPLNLVPPPTKQYIMTFNDFEGGRSFVGRSSYTLWLTSEICNLHLSPFLSWPFTFPFHHHHRENF